MNLQLYVDHWHTFYQFQICDEYVHDNHNIFDKITNFLVKSVLPLSLHPNTNILSFRILNFRINITSVDCHNRETVSKTYVRINWFQNFPTMENLVRTFELKFPFDIC